MPAKLEDMKPRPAAGFDWRRASLSASEGYLLSRIDGATTVRELGLVAGMPFAEMVSALRKLQSLGAIEGLALDEREARALPSQAPEAPAGAKASGAAAARPGPTRADAARTLEQHLADMRVLLAREANHYEILGVSTRATEAEIRSAFFRLSKRFHPDVYFGRELGDDREVLQDVYEAVRTAYEVLSDKARRGLYDRERKAMNPEEQARRERDRAIEERREQIRTERRDRVNPFVKRVQSSRTLYEEGRAAFEAGKYEDAVRALKTAQTLDPKSDVVTTWLDRAMTKRDEQRTKAEIDAAERAAAEQRFLDAAQHYILAADLVPHNRTIAVRAVQAAVDYGVEPDGLLRLARRLVDQSPRNPQLRYLLGRCLEIAGDLLAAEEAYTEAAQQFQHTGSQERLEFLQGKSGRTLKRLGIFGK